LQTPLSLDESKEITKMAKDAGFSGVSIRDNQKTIDILNLHDTNYENYCNVFEVHEKNSGICELWECTEALNSLQNMDGVS
jgi:hypothetical protein